MHKSLVRYHNGVEKGLGFLHYFFGPPGSLPAFFACISVSYGYSIMFFLIWWLVDGSGTLQNFEILPHEPFFTRIISVAAVIPISFILTIIFFKSDIIAKKILSNVTYFDPLFHINLFRMLYYAVMIISSIVVLYFLSIRNIEKIDEISRFALILFGSVIFSFLMEKLLYAAMRGKESGPTDGEGPGVGAGSLVFGCGLASIFLFGMLGRTALALGFLFFFVSTISTAVVINRFQSQMKMHWDYAEGAITWGLIFIFIVILIIFMASPQIIIKSGDISRILFIVLIFFGTLPIINGISDFTSLYISQKFIRSAKNYSETAWSLDDFMKLFCFFIILDLIAAIICLVLLAFILACSMSFADIIAVKTFGSSVLQIEELILHVQIAPHSEGLWVFLMLISTIWPTIFHVAILLVGVGIPIFFAEIRLIERILAILIASIVLLPVFLFGLHFISENISDIALIGISCGIYLGEFAVLAVPTIMLGCFSALFIRYRRLRKM